MKFFIKIFKTILYYIDKLANNGRLIVKERIKMNKKIMKNYDFSIEELREPNIKSDRIRVNLGSIIEQMSDELLDFNPPYQRGKVWKNEFNVELIRSILDETPIGAIHFVKKSSNIQNGEKWVLDAKQRLLAIDALNNGKLKIKLRDENGNVEDFGLKDMKKSDKWKFIHQKIWSYQIDIVTWDHCNFSQQKEIFERVNNSVALTAYETMYGQHFIVKQLLKYFFDNAFVPKEYLNKSIAEDNRNNGIKLLHSLLVLCYGPNLDDVYAPRSLSAANIDKSCKVLEKRLLDLGIDANTSNSQFNTELLEKLDVKSIFDTLKTVSKWFERAAEYKNSLKKGKKFESIFVLDILVFLIKKHRDNILTNSYVEQNLDKLHDFITKWSDFKNDEENSRSIKSRSTNVNTIKMKMDKMEELFINANFDNTIKNVGLTKNQKLIASLNSGLICPISGAALSDKNVQFDHLSAKSISGTTKVACLTDFANNRKSDQSIETVMKTNELLNDQ